jgi:iron complex outermembrane receptor protein
VRAQLLFEPSPSFSILLAADYNKQRSTGFNGSNFSVFLDEEGDFAESVAAVENPRDILTGPLGEDYFNKHGGVRARVTYRTDGPVQHPVYRQLPRPALRGRRRRAGDRRIFRTSRRNSTAERSARNGSTISRRPPAAAIPGPTSTSSDSSATTSRSNTRLAVTTSTSVSGTIAASVADFNSFFQGQEFNTRTKSEAYAFYGDGTYSVTDALRVTAGLRYTNDRKSRTGVIARNFFGGGAGDFNCCGFFRLGTPGFEFNRDRTIFDPDQNSDGIISSGEQLVFFLDGIKSFGARDTIPVAFGPAIDAIRRNPALVSDPNFGIPSGPGCINSARNPGYVCAADGNFTYNFLANTINNQASSIKTDFFDFRARIEYDLTPENLVYGVISRGHKAASFNDNLGSLGPAPFFRPEEVTLYEVGTKNEFDLFGRRAVLNLSAFYNDYKDQQLTALLGVQSIIQQITGPDGNLIDVSGPQVIPDGFNQNQVVAFTYNAANSETYGIQGSGSIILPGNFKFGADFLYLEAKVKDADPVQDFRFQADIEGLDSVARPISGRRLPYAPRFQLNASLAQVIPVDRLGGLFDWLVSVSYRSSSFATIFNSRDFAFENRETFPDGPNAGQIRVGQPRATLFDRIPSYALVNLAFGFTRDQIRIEGYVNNLFDKTIAAGLLVNQFNNTRFFTNPRIYGGRVRVKF